LACPNAKISDFILSIVANDHLDRSVPNISRGMIPLKTEQETIKQQMNWWTDKKMSSHCKKKLQNSGIFFYQNFQKQENPPCWQGIFWCPPEKQFFVFWGGKSISLSAGVIFSSLLIVIFPYFPYFPIKLTGKLMEDSWLATGAPGRVAIKFGRWEKNLAPFVGCKCENQWKF
jgi:hypothetical protein